MTVRKDSSMREYWLVERCKIQGERLLWDFLMADGSFDKDRINAKKFESLGEKIIKEVDALKKIHQDYDFNIHHVMCFNGFCES